MLSKATGLLPNIETSDLLRPGFGFNRDDNLWLKGNCPHGWWQCLLISVGHKNYKKIFTDEPRNDFGLIQAHNNFIDTAEAWMTDKAVDARLKQERTDWYVYLSEYKMLKPGEAHDIAFNAGRLRRLDNDRET